MVDKSYRNGVCGRKGRGKYVREGGREGERVTETHRERERKREKKELIRRIIIQFIYSHIYASAKCLPTKERKAYTDQSCHHADTSIRNHHQSNSVC